MGERVAAVPGRLLEHAVVASAVADELRRAAAELGVALDAVRVRCADVAAAVPDVAAELGTIAARVDAIGELVHAVGVALAAAGAASPDGVFSADAVAADAAATQAAARGWRPEGKRTAMDPAAWWRAVWGDRCDAGDLFYGGGRGAIAGPDGRLYPLVSPSVVCSGLVYNADWGRADGSRVGDLLGADPGWRTVDVETGVERHRAAPGLFERIFVGAGSTVAGPPAGSTKGAVEAVVLEPGAAPRLAVVPVRVAQPGPQPSTPLSAEPLRANVGLVAPIALDITAGVLNADDGAHDAYQVVFEEHPDGRRRATYLRVDVLPATATEAAMLVASHVVGPGLDDRIPVRYLGPDRDTVSDGRHTRYEPPPGALPGDRR